jgi:hypothetical protein
MTVGSETRYARSGDVSIAYQVTGEGPFDVVYVPPFSHTSSSPGTSLEWPPSTGSGIAFRDRGAAELKGSSRRVAAVRGQERLTLRPKPA